MAVDSGPGLRSVSGCQSLKETRSAPDRSARKSRKNGRKREGEVGLWSSFISKFQKLPVYAYVLKYEYAYIWTLSVTRQRTWGQNSHPDEMVAPNKSLCRPLGPDGCYGWDSTGWSP